MVVFRRRARRNKYNSLSFMRNLSGSLNRGLLFPLYELRGETTRDRETIRRGERERERETGKRRKKEERKRKSKDPGRGECGDRTTLIERFTKAQDGEISMVSRCDIARERRG